MNVLVGAGKVEELAAAGGDNEGNLGIAEHRELQSFVEQTAPSFREGHLPVYRVLDSLQYHFPSSHL